MSDTVLTLSGIGITPFSARGLSEALTLVDQGRQLRRTVNGALIDLSLSAFQKYRLTISGSDIQPAALNGVWPGQAVTVGCITELSQKVTLVAGAATVVLDRPYVAGSGRAVRANGEWIALSEDVTLNTISGPAYEALVDFNDTSVSGEAFVIYRPQLSCIVTGFSTSRDEWGASNDWSMDLEEV